MNTHEALPTFVRFSQLKKSGIVPNRTTLGRWIRTGNFPKPVFLGPNVCAWRQSDIEEWLHLRGEVHVRQSNNGKKATAKTATPTRKRRTA
jgi:predicted DNA-binding transcriptional regulator AlpA